MIAHPRQLVPTLHAISARAYGLVLLIAMCSPVATGGATQAADFDQRLVALQDDPAPEAGKPAAGKPEPDKKVYAKAVVITVNGMLTPMVEQSFRRRLREARSLKPDLLVLEIDSPGGFVDTSVDMAEAMLRVDWARTVAWVPRSAMSGAAILSLGCDEIVIAPSAQFGDAGMIEYDFQQGGFKYAEEKYRSALASQLRTLAKEKGRPPALAEALVDMNLEVFRVRHKQTGQETFMSSAELKAARDADQWETLRPVFEAREKHFLTMDGKGAIDLQLATALVASRADLKTHYGLTNDLIVLEHRGVDTAVMILNNALVTGLILVIGLIALYCEFSFPGTFIGGLVAGLCFAVFFWSRFLGGTAGWLEVILFVAGLIFIGMELFVIPGFGVPGILGLLLVGASLIMASQTFFLPHNGRELSTTLTQLGIVGGVGTAFIIVAAVMSRYVGVLPGFRKLVLEVPVESAGPVGTGTASHPLPVAADIPVTVGDHGIADSTLRPAGKVRFGDHYVDVVTEGSFVDRGRPVRVVQVAGNRVVVREVAPVES